MAAHARNTTRRMSVLLGVTLAAVVLGGCAASRGDVVTGSSSGPTVAEGEGAVAPDPGAGSGSDGFPTCEEVKAALGEQVDGLIELDDSENGVSTGSDGPFLSCSWFTPETDGSSIDVAQYGGVSIGISRDPEYTEQSMEMLGWNVADARVAGAGAWALKVGGGYDPGEQLDALGVQVVRDGVVVVLTSGGAVLQDVPKLASLTNEWALGAGVAVLESMD